MLNLDLNILDSCSLKKLVIADDSDYGNLKIQNPSLEIKAPGFNKVNVHFSPNEANRYTSESLGISCGEFVDIPDGIYYIKYSIKPNLTNFIEKTFLRTEHLQCKYGKFLLNLHLDCGCNKSASNVKKLKEIKMLIEGTIAASNDCNIELSYDLYNQANCLLDKMGKCSC